MKKINFFILILTLLALTLGIINIHITNKVAAESTYVIGLENEIKNLSRSNRLLRSETLTYTSIEWIASRAGELGFVEPRNFISLYSPTPLALKK